jgi:hypothetical protein
VQEVLDGSEKRMGDTPGILAGHPHSSEDQKLARQLDFRAEKAAGLAEARGFHRVSTSFSSLMSWQASARALADFSRSLKASS